MRRPDLILFAKTPLPGLAKTRLLSAYSTRQVVEIASCLIRATVEFASRCWPGQVFLCVTSDTAHALFADLEREYRIRLALQSPGDLGEKMHQALKAGIARSGAAAIMGCDVPHCPADVLDRANRWLEEGRNVIGPTEDGGYYLIGMNAARRDLFQDIEWGGPGVYATTMARARKGGIGFETLPALRDIDTPEDLRRIARKCDVLQKFV